jgi:hypothetical protein
MPIAPTPISPWHPKLALAFLQAAFQGNPVFSSQTVRKFDGPVCGLRDCPHPAGSQPYDWPTVRPVDDSLAQKNNLTPTSRSAAIPARANTSGSKTFCGMIENSRRPTRAATTTIGIMIRSNWSVAGVILPRDA